MYYQECLHTCKPRRSLRLAHVKYHQLNPCLWKYKPRKTPARQNRNWWLPLVTKQDKRGRRRRQPPQPQQPQRRPDQTAVRRLASNSNPSHLSQTCAVSSFLYTRQLISEALSYHKCAWMKPERHMELRKPALTRALCLRAHQRLQLSKWRLPRGTHRTR